MSDATMLLVDGYGVSEVPQDSAVAAYQRSLADAESDIAPLVPQILYAASASCDALVAQFAPTETHKFAYGTAAMIVRGNAGKAPTVGPEAIAFTQFAASAGMEPDAFASAAEAVSLVVLQLAAALSTLRMRAMNAQKMSDLNQSRDAFEDTLAALIARLNGAGLSIQSTQPDPIVIIGASGLRLPA